MKRLAIVPVVLVAFGLVWVVLRDDASPAASTHSAAPVVASAPAAQPRTCELAPSSPAPTARVVAPASAVPSPDGKTRPGELPVAEGARHLAGYLAQADRPADVRALGATLAKDPEMLPLVEAEARKLASSTDAAVRARGIVIQGAIGALDTDGWKQALAAESDAHARELIVASPPFGHGNDDRILDALVDTAERDPSAAVRIAAVTALPAQPGPARLAALVQVLQGDASPDVRRTAATWFRGALVADPTVVRGLWASATGVSEDAAVRRASARALARIEESAPGTLGVVGANTQQLEVVLAQTSQDKG